METKLDEKIIVTSNIDEMKDKFLSERLLRKWSEDFADEDTGEVVSIERSEVILEKGTLLDSKTISEVNFFIQSGDIKEISVSNQQRGCNLVIGNPCVWVVSISLNGKKKNIYLYSNSLKIATKICIDFVEQKYDGAFKILGVKELDFSTLIALDMKEEDAHEENDYYKIEVEITYQNQEPTNQVFIINASNAEKAKKLIIDSILVENERKGQKETFETTIISAKTINCNDIIDVAFSKKYFLED